MMSHTDRQGDLVKHLISEMSAIDGKAMAALTQLADLGEPAVNALIRLVGEGDIHQRVNAIGMLEHFCDTRAVEALLNLRTHPHPWVRMSSAKALGALRCPEAVAGLLAWLPAEPDTLVLIWIALSLGKLGDHSATESLIALLQAAQSETLRYSVLRALGDLGDKCAISAIRPYLADPDRHVSKHAQQALALLESRSGEEGAS